jgi:hypothetical protein
MTNAMKEFKAVSDISEEDFANISEVFVTNEQRGIKMFYTRLVELGQWEVVRVVHLCPYCGRSDSTSTPIVLGEDDVLADLTKYGQLADELVVDGGKIHIEFYTKKCEQWPKLYVEHNALVSVSRAS